MEANVFCNFWPNLCLSWCVYILHQQLYSNLTYSLCFTISLMTLQRVIGQMLFPLPVWFESLFSSTALIALLPPWVPLTPHSSSWTRSRNSRNPGILAQNFQCLCCQHLCFYTQVWVWWGTGVICHNWEWFSSFTADTICCIETYTSWFRDSDAFCLAWDMPSTFWKSFTGDFCRKNSRILKTMWPCWLIHFLAMLSSHLSSPRLSLKDGDPFIYPFLLPESISHVSTTSFA